MTQTYCNSLIDLFLDENSLRYGINRWIKFSLDRSPMGLVVGPSGSGKTYACKQILARIRIATPCEIFVVDQKSDDDFLFLDGCKHFYRYPKCGDGLHEFYNRFQQRQNGTDKDRHPLILFFDEWSSYCNAGDKKSIEEDKKLLGILVSMGRSFRCHVIISQQRADAIYFNQFRDNFTLCVGMGNLSDESRKMLFPDYAKDLPSDRARGTGYLSLNGQKPIPIFVPPIKDIHRVHRIIREAVDT